MDPALILFIVLAAALAFAPSRARYNHFFGHIRLNLRITGICKGQKMAKIGDQFTASIAPTNAEAAPAAVSNVVFACDSPAYTVVPNADGTATYTAAAVGAANATVSATSAAGVALTDSKPLPAVVAVDGEATALNLAITAVVPGAAPAA